MGGIHIKTLVVKIDSDDSEKIHQAISDMHKQLGVTVAFYELSDAGIKKVDELIHD